MEADINQQPSTVDDLTICYYENGVEVVKELAKEILTKGAWTTIIYKYQEWEDQAKAYSVVKYSIRRYQKQRGIYKMRSKFNISNVEQAKKIIAVLTKWTTDENING